MKHVEIIAEAAVEHLGSLTAAKRMADCAKEIGVDVIKYQMHIPNAEMVPNSISFWGGSLDEVLASYNLTVDHHEKLIEHCKNIGIEYLCTPFCSEAVKLLDELGVKRFKTGSGELLNFDLMGAVIDTGKPVIVSTGMATIEEVTETIEFFGTAKRNLSLAHCTSLYPTPDAGVCLNRMGDLRKQFNVSVGLSDHTPDILSSIGSVFMGADFIEKHFTLDKFMKGPDWEVSLDPDNMEKLVLNVRRAQDMLTSRDHLFHGEEQVRNWAHHSVTTVRFIKSGNPIKEADLKVRRPGHGIPGQMINDVIGKQAKRDLEPDTIINWSDISN